MTIRAADRDSWSRWLAAGLGIGLAALSRPTIAPFLLLGTFIWITVRDVRGRAWRRWLVSAPVLGGGTMTVVIAPVTLRNYLAGGEFVPISGLGGINLYIGNNPEANRTIAIRPGPEWEDLLALPHSERRVTDSEAERFYLSQVAAYAKSDPARFARGLLAKAVLTVNAREEPRVFDPYFHRRFSSLLGVLLWRIGPFGFPFGVLAALAVVGAALAVRRNHAGGLALIYVAATAAPMVVFFVAGRYRLPMVPVVAIFATAGVGLAWPPVPESPISLADRRSRRHPGIGYSDQPASSCPFEPSQSGGCVLWRSGLAPGQVRARPAGGGKCRPDGTKCRSG